MSGFQSKLIKLLLKCAYFRVSHSNITHTCESQSIKVNQILLKRVDLRVSHSNITHTCESQSKLNKILGSLRVENSADLDQNVLSYLGQYCLSRLFRWTINVSNFNLLLHNNAFWCHWNIMYLKILWKMEHLLFLSKFSIFHSIIESVQNLKKFPEFFQCCLKIENDDMNAPFSIIVSKVFKT